MNQEELEKLGFVHDIDNGIFFLDFNDTELIVFHLDNFITIHNTVENIHGCELRNVNTIEKVKQLIELLK